MKFLNLLALLPVVLAAVNAHPSNAGTTRAEAGALAPQACGCQHNNDAGRFRDVLKPSDRLNALCQQGGGCYQADAGRMCVQGDLGQCACAVQSAQEWESFHDDWFLWSAITCGGLTITIT